MEYRCFSIILLFSNKFFLLVCCRIKVGGEVRFSDSRYPVKVSGTIVPVEELLTVDRGTDELGDCGDTVMTKKASCPRYFLRYMEWGEVTAEEYPGRCFFFFFFVCSCSHATLLDHGGVLVTNFSRLPSRPEGRAQ